MRIPLDDRMGGIMKRYRVTSLLNTLFQRGKSLGLIYFTKAHLAVHLCIILGTIGFAWSGLDWAYVQFIARHPFLESLGAPAFSIGFFIPFIPLFFFLFARIRKQEWGSNVGYSVLLAEGIAWFTSVFYKIVSGRTPPAQIEASFSTDMQDMSRIFHVGFFREGIFYGWPSGHTIVAFAMAACIARSFPRHRWIGYGLYLYACYIGFGVSTSVHWLSDVLAGAGLGIAIGILFSRRFETKNI